jgi:hypothetical protein
MPAPPTITISRDGANSLAWQPRHLDLTPASFGAPARLTGRVRVRPPLGWSVAAGGPLTWRATPWTVDLDRSALFLLETEEQRWTLEVGVALELRSVFDPEQHALLLPNSAAVLGEHTPQRSTFEATFRALPRPMARALFAGLYSDIVFLRSGAGPHGGLCSGMARWAIARGRGDEPAPASTADALARISVYHGRQLCDRALLSALPWFLRGSPAAAYRAVRRDLLARGQTDRALDIGVPKLWRRDLATAIVREGHTVVPYALRQPDAESATLTVYDPNHPEALGTATPRAIEFDLRRNRYRFGTLVGLGQHDAGMIAVHQDAYTRRGTALLACAGSLLLTPRRAFGALLGRLGHAEART